MYSVSRCPSSVSEDGSEKKGAAVHGLTRVGERNKVGRYLGYIHPTPRGERRKVLKKPI